MGGKLRDFRRKGTLRPVSAAKTVAERASHGGGPGDPSDSVHPLPLVRGLAAEDDDLITVLGVAQTARSPNASLRRLACPHKSLR